jgi:hypothetical protein
MDKVISRRRLLNLSARSVAGAGLLSAVPGVPFLTSLDRIAGGPSLGAAGSAQALVCIYCFGGGDDDNLLAGGGLHPALDALQPLYREKVLAVVENVAAPARASRITGTPGEVTAQRYSALRFLPNGFATLEWAARAGGVKPITGDGAYTFASGMSMVAPGARVDGAQFENATIREVTTRFDAAGSSFPDTSLGRQLADVSRLLRAAGTLGMTRQIFLVGAAGWSRDAKRTGMLTERYRDLGQSMAAFYRATVELGIARQVIMYTDGEFAPASKGRVGSRLVLGGSVVGGDARGSAPLSQDSYAGAMAGWLGLRSVDVQRQFPEFKSSSLGVIA